MKPYTVLTPRKYAVLADPLSTILIADATSGEAAFNKTVDSSIDLDRTQVDIDDNKDSDPMNKVIYRPRNIQTVRTEVTNHPTTAYQSVSAHPTASIMTEEVSPLSIVNRRSSVAKVLHQAREESFKRSLSVQPEDLNKIKYTETPRNLYFSSGS